MRLNADKNSTKKKAFFCKKVITKQDKNETKISQKMNDFFIAKLCIKSSDISSFFHYSLTNDFALNILEYYQLLPYPIPNSILCNRTKNCSKFHIKKKTRKSKLLLKTSTAGQ